MWGGLGGGHACVRESACVYACACVLKTCAHVFENECVHANDDENLGGLYLQHEFVFVFRLYSYK